VIAAGIAAHDGTIAAIAHSDGTSRELQNGAWSSQRRAAARSLAMKADETSQLKHRPELRAIGVRRLRSERRAVTPGPTAAPDTIEATGHHAAKTAPVGVSRRFRRARRRR
jgi:hypothetical protein